MIVMWIAFYFAGWMLAQLQYGSSLVDLVHCLNDARFNETRLRYELLECEAVRLRRGGMAPVSK